MEIDKDKIIDILIRHMEDQGCEDSNLESLKLMQPHIYEWIMFFEVDYMFRDSDAGGKNDS